MDHTLLATTVGQKSQPIYVFAAAACSQVTGSPPPDPPAPTPPAPNPPPPEVVVLVGPPCAPVLTVPPCAPMLVAALLSASSGSPSSRPMIALHPSHTPRVGSAPRRIKLATFMATSPARPALGGISA